jgi:hypothetical protein
MCNPDGSTLLVEDDLDVTPDERLLLSFTIRPCTAATVTRAPVEP